MELFTLMIIGVLVALFAGALFARQPQPQVHYVVVEREATPQGGAGIGLLMLVGLVIFVLFSGAF